MIALSLGQVQVARTTIRRKINIRENCEKFFFDNLVTLDGLIQVYRFDTAKHRTMATPSQ
jgi:hypothetical protein